MTSRATIRIAVALALCHAGLAETTSRAGNGLAVRAVKFWSLGNSTRIAIEVTDEFHYRKDRLDNPDRMFVDIAGAKTELTPGVLREEAIDIYREWSRRKDHRSY